VVKTIDSVNDLINARPEAIRIFRHYFPTGQPLDPDWATETILNALGGYRHPNLYVEVYNETYEHIDSGLQQYADFLEMVVPRLKQSGLKVAGPSWATGAYEEQDWNYLRGRQWCGLDAIALHAYWANHGFTEWNALRFVKYWQPNDPPILITECGRDKVRDAPYGMWSGAGGWKADGLSCETYLSELRDYDSKLRELPFVLGATVFTCASYDTWHNYDADFVSAYLPPDSAPSSHPQPAKEVEVFSFRLGFGDLAERLGHEVVGSPQMDEASLPIGGGKVLTFQVTTKGMMVYVTGGQPIFLPAQLEHGFFTGELRG
jgi:hypothetical protein